MVEDVVKVLKAQGAEAKRVHGVEDPRIPEEDKGAKTS